MLCILNSPQSGRNPRGKAGSRRFIRGLLLVALAPLITLATAEPPGTVVVTGTAASASVTTPTAVGPMPPGICATPGEPTDIMAKSEKAGSKKGRECVRRDNRMGNSDQLALEAMVEISTRERTFSVAKFESPGRIFRRDPGNVLD